jgi:hypothetical protein
MGQVIFMQPLNSFGLFNSFDTFASFDYFIYTNRNTFEDPLAVKA